MIDISGLIDRLGGSTAYNPVTVLVEIGLIALAINWCVGMLQGARGTRPLKGLLVLLLVATVIVRILTTRLDWPRLQLLYQYFVAGLAVVALVAFQPELRRAFMRAGGLSFVRRGAPKSKLVAALIKSAGYLSRNKYGALVAIQRDVDLRGWATNGTPMNAEVSGNLLSTVFFPNSPLHDLGVVIHGNRVLAANCQFPQAESEEVDVSLGSRHLAAIGMSYETDALVLVVSEETGTISLADNGHLTRFLTLDDLEKELETRLGRRRSAAARTRRLHGAWRIVRRVLVVLPLTVVLWYLADQASQDRADGVVLELRAKPPPTLDIEFQQPEDRRFGVAFSGTTRAIRELEAQAADGVLYVDWPMPASYTVGEVFRNSRELIADLPDIRRLGVSIQNITPADVRFTVYRLETVSMPVRADGGSVRTADEQFDPASVQVTMRGADLERVPAPERYVAARLESVLQGVAPGETVTRPRVPLGLGIGRFRAVRIDPDSVKATVRVVGERIQRRLTGIRVDFVLSPQAQRLYEVELRDPNEWLIEVEVEGDRSVVDSLSSEDVQAFVRITTDDTPTADVRAWDVTLKLPKNVQSISPRPIVHFRLVRRAAVTP